MAKAAAMFESVLPLIDRDRNPDFYATVVGNLGYTLIALGDFDRALMLQTEALELFSARGDDGQTARTLAALGAIQFRTGDVERALESLRSALPLFENAGDVVGLSSALRLTGNAAAELDQHDLALEYLRRVGTGLAERRHHRNARACSSPASCASSAICAAPRRLLARACCARRTNRRARMRSPNARACASGSSARAEALADLRAADAIYARLKLDFNRIDTSSALALALLDAGDVRGAGAAADTAIAIETRIRVKSANPELRARFLSASYAPYEARIEADLAGASPDDPAAMLEGVPHGRGDSRPLAGRPARAFGARRRVVPRDAETERLREKMTALQMDLERRMRKGDSDDAATLELRRQIDEARARLEARILVQRGVQRERRARACRRRAKPCRPRCPRIRRCSRTSSATGVRTPGC